MSDFCSQLNGKKALVVMNGQYYAGVNTQENNLIFEPERTKAVPVEEEQLKFILSTISGWVMDNEVVLQRLEILRPKGSKLRNLLEVLFQMEDLIDRLWKIDAQIEDIYDDLKENWKDNGLIYSGQIYEYEKQVEDYVDGLKDEAELLVAQLVASGFSDRDKLPGFVHYVVLNRKDV